VKNSLLDLIIDHYAELEELIEASQNDDVG